jgi:O-antigen/teichoic acid export membrane protein
MVRKVSAHRALPDHRVAIALRSLLISYSLPLFLASTWLSIVLLRCNAMLAQRYSLAEVALYSAADRFHLMLLFVPGALFATMFPILANLRGDRGGCRQVLRTCFMSMLLTLVFPAVLVAGFAETILAASFGAEFRIAGTVLSLLCVAAVFEAINIVAGQLLLIAGWIKLRAAIDALLGTVLLVLSILWIPRFGTRGFAAAYAISFGCAGLLLLAAAATIRNAGAEKTLAPDQSVGLLKPELQQPDVHVHA